MIELSVYDRDATRDELMGFTNIDINSLEPETNHHIVKELEGGEGCIHLMVTVSGTLTTPGHISDLASYDRNHADREALIRRRYVSVPGSCCSNFLKCYRMTMYTMSTILDVTGELELRDQAIGICTLQRNSKK